MISMRSDLLANTARWALSSTYSDLGKCTGRLSAGLRIATAADGPAEISVIGKMKSWIHCLDTGLRNASDGISMIQTAEGALAVIDEKLIRMKELAEQAATGTYTTIQREIINAEYQAMAEEINRIALATDFNGTKLLDGSLTEQHAGKGLKIHFGTGNNPEEDYYFINIAGCTCQDLFSRDAVLFRSLDDNGSPEDNVPIQTYSFITEEILVNTETAGNQSQPATSGLQNGNIVVTWQSANQDGNGYGIYGQILDQSGAKQGGEFQINTETISDQTNPAVTILNNGNFVVTWESMGQDGSDSGIYGQMFSEEGTRIGGEFRINSHTLDWQAEPSISSLSNGGFVVSWTSSNQDGADKGVYAQIFDENANQVGGEFQVNQFTTSNQEFSSVTGLQGGGFVVTYRCNDIIGRSGEVLGRIYDNAGNPQGNEFIVNTYNIGRQRLPSVSSLSDGGFIVAWQSLYQDGSEYGIYGQRYHADGTKNGSEFRVNTETNDHQERASVAGLDDGGFFVTWASMNQDGSGWGIYGQEYNADGSPSGSEFQINEEVYSNQMYPSVTSLSGGGYAVSWQSAFQDGYLDGIYIKIWGNGVVNPDDPEQPTDEDLYANNPLYITTQSAAQDALSLISEAILRKDQIRANLGATQNRLDNTIVNLSIQKEQLQAAESRIADLDFASEMTEFTKINIKTQTGVAMLSQANSNEIVLSILNLK